MDTLSVVIAHPSPDLYGSDLQMLVTVEALRGLGADVTVLLPEDGPLSERLRALGATVRFVRFPVLRKSVLSPRGVVRFAAQTLRAAWVGREFLRCSHADLLLVNTLTLPSWLLAGRESQIPVLAHVHEAEEDQPRLVRLLLAAQLLLTDRVVANSDTTRRFLTGAVPALAPRITVVHNGVPGPSSPSPLPARCADGPMCVALVSRLSPRKGIMVALDAVGQLRAGGRDIRLTVCGTVFPGYEWFEKALHERAAQPDLEGAVQFLGYVSPVWPVLEKADAVVVPSFGESFGNAAVEAMHAGRPLVASAVQGLTEVLTDGLTGILVPPGDPVALAEGVRQVADDPAAAAVRASRAQQDAAERFSTAVYGRRITDVLEGCRRSVLVVRKRR